MDAIRTRVTAAVTAGMPADEDDPGGRHRG